MSFVARYRARLASGFGLVLAVLIATVPCHFASAADQAVPEAKTEAPEATMPGAPPAAKVRLIYLGKAYDEPVPLSLVDKILTDNGVQGARLAIGDNNKSGRFLGQDFELVETIVPKDGDVAVKAKELLAAGDKLIVADLEAPDLLAVASLPEAKDAVILNIRSSEESLRQEQCKPNLFHITPDWAMRADALAQYMIWKKWDRWLLLKGTAPTDEEYAKAVKRAAERFGGEIVEERVYKFEAGNARTDSGHQQVQTQMPSVTQGAADHDVVWVADTVEAFGEYVPYRTNEPKPVIGTQGLTATAWHRSYEQYAVAVIDTATWKIVKKIRFEVAGVRPELLQPVGIEFTKDGKSVFVALGPGNRVAVIDPKTYEVKDYILVGQRPWHLELSADHSKLYVANGLTNDMTIIDVASLKAEKSVPVGRLPWGVAVVP